MNTNENANADQGDRDRDKKQLFGNALETPSTQRNEFDNLYKAIEQVMQSQAEQRDAMNVLMQTANMIGDTTTQTQNKMIDEFDANTERMKKQTDFLKEIRKDIKNLPEKYGCGTGSIKSVLKCIISMIEMLIRIIQLLFYTYTYLISFIKSTYHSALIGPLSIIALALDTLILLFNMYLISMIIMYIGYATGDDKLLQNCIRIFYRFTLQSLTYIKHSSPIQFAKQMIKDVPGILHEETMNSEFGENYEYYKNYSNAILTGAGNAYDTVIEIPGKIQEIKDYIPDPSQYIPTIDGSVDTISTFAGNSAHTLNSFYEDLVASKFFTGGKRNKKRTRKTKRSYKLKKNRMRMTKRKNKLRKSKRKGGDGDKNGLVPLEIENNSLIPKNTFSNKHKIIHELPNNMKNIHSKILELLVKNKDIDVTKKLTPIQEDILEFNKVFFDIMLQYAVNVVEQTIKLCNDKNIKQQKLK